MTSRFEIQVTGRLPHALTQAISGRFGRVEIDGQANATVLNGRIADQAALRSLLGLIWDTGGSIHTLRNARPRRRLADDLTECAQEHLQNDPARTRQQARDQHRGRGGGRAESLPRVTS
jgi:hypothetical protein